MAQYSPHLRLLLTAILVLLFLLLATALVGGASFQSALLYSLTLLALLVFVLARFGGDLGRTQ